MYRKAHDKLHELWGNKENDSRQKWRETFRLLFADKDNTKRFRQGFSQMLSVQYNSEADRALESELRLNKPELSEENFCCQLEDYLRQGDWRKADEETAWLFYLVMVQQGYENWYELCEKFPSEILNEIDQLWVNYSQGQFGFSIQKRMLESVGGNPNADWDAIGGAVMHKFEEQVEWFEAIDGRDYYSCGKDYYSMPFSTESPDGQLPAQVFTHSDGRRLCPEGEGGWFYYGSSMILGWWRFECLTSLLLHQDLTYKV